MLRRVALASSLILVTLMMALRTTDTAFLTRATRRNVPEDGILFAECISTDCK
jgi:hypothetical protein